MANAKLGKSMLLSFFLISAAMAGKETQEELAQRIFVVDRLPLISLKYDGICNSELMIHFRHISFLKNFINFETLKEEHPDNVAEMVKNDLLAYKSNVESFLVNINTELETMKEYPGHYLVVKFLFLLNRARKRSGLKAIEETQVLISHEDEIIHKGKHNGLYELKTKPLDLSYLYAARSQLLSAESPEVKSYQKELKFFRDHLLDTLINILVFIEEATETPEMDAQRLADTKKFLANFFLVFGELVPREDFAQMVLNHVVGKHKNPQFNDPEAPDLLKELPIYESRLPGGIYQPIMNVDRLFFDMPDDFYNVDKILAVKKADYDFHPHWNSFFDIKKKQDNTHWDDKLKDAWVEKDTEGNEEVFKNGHKYIYYFYVDQRQRGNVPEVKDELPADQLKRVGEILYEKLSNFDCYEGNNADCSFQQLMDRDEFTRYYLVMLALLKPFSEKPKEFTDTEIENFVRKGKNLGIKQATEMQPLLEKKFPGFGERKQQKIASALSNKINDFLKSADLRKDEMPNNLEGDDLLDAIAGETNVLKNIEKIEESLNKELEKSFPSLSQESEDPTVLQEQIEDLKTIIDNSKEISPKQRVVVDGIVIKKRDKLRKVNWSALPPEKKQQSEEALKKLEKQIEDDAVRNIIERTGARQITGFMEYLRSTLVDQTYKNKLGSTKTFYFASRRYDRWRLLDLYVFLYRATLYNEPTEGTTIENFIHAHEESFNVNAIEKQGEVKKYEYSLILMGSFLKMFEMHRVNSGVINEKNHSLEFLPIFHRIYQFLCDIRDGSGDLLALSKSFGDFRKLVSFQLHKCLRESYAITVVDKSNESFYAKFFKPQEACHITGRQHSPNGDSVALFGIKKDAIENFKQKEVEWLKSNTICRQNFSFYAQVYPLLTIYLARSADQGLISARFFQIVNVPNMPLINLFRFHYFLERQRSDREVQQMYNSFCDYTINAGDFAKISTQKLSKFIPNKQHTMCQGFDNFNSIRSFFMESSEDKIEDMKVTISNIITKLSLSDIKTFKAAEAVMFQIWEVVAAVHQRSEGSGGENYMRSGSIWASSFSDILKNPAFERIAQIIEKEPEGLTKVVSHYLSLKYANFFLSEYEEKMNKLVIGTHDFLSTENLRDLVIIGDKLFKDGVAYLVKVANCPSNFDKLASLLVETRQDRELFTYTEGFDHFFWKLHAAVQDSYSISEISSTIKSLMIATFKELLANKNEALPEPKTVVAYDENDIEDTFGDIIINEDEIIENEESYTMAEEVDTREILGVFGNGEGLSGESELLVRSKFYNPISEVKNLLPSHGDLQVKLEAEVVGGQSPKKQELVSIVAIARRDVPKGDEIVSKLVKKNTEIEERRRRLRVIL